MEWTDERVTILIENYRDKKELWDPKNELYKNRNRRHDALMEISRALEVSKDEVERKIKNLQGQFLRESKKTRSKKSGSGAEDSYESKWFAFKLLLFLKDKNIPRQTVDTSEDNDQISLDESDPSETVYDRAQLNDSTENEVQTAEEDNGERRLLRENETAKKSFVSPSKISRPKNKRKQEDSMAQEAYQIMKSVYKKKRERDEYDLFGEQIACKLRKLPSDRARSHVQHIINTTFWEAECGLLDNYAAPRYGAAPPLAISQSHSSAHFAPSFHGHAGQFQNFSGPYNASLDQNQNHDATIPSGTALTQNSSENPAYYSFAPSPTMSRDNQSPYSTCSTPMASPSLSYHSEYSSEHEDTLTPNTWTTL